ncbi:MAG: FAD-dependent oxidoreductase [Theionarchaea archaeon]|nr:FAD-dependent oxidoreductase [Theionarchaea archaeon]
MKEDNCDVVVVGGGLAGVCAAIQAARLGSRTVLIERELVLGGNSNASFRLHLLGAATPYGRETGIIEELEAEAGNRHAYHPHWGYLNSEWSAILRERCDEAGVDLCLKCVANGVTMNGNRIERISAEDMLSHGSRSFEVDGMVVDASGDGDVAFSAGATFRQGREASGEFDESFAPDEPDRKTMGSALLFSFRDAGHPVKFEPPEGTPVYEIHDDMPMGGHHAYIDESETPISGQPIIWQAQYGWPNDTATDDEVIYRELLKIVYGIVDHIKNRKPHGAENYELNWISPFLGKRESRRFVGDYILNQNDMFKPTEFPDRVAYGGRSVDLHEVTDDGKHYEVIFYGKPPLYSIPFRSLYSRDVDNLLLAGRLISGTRVALGSYRVMKTLATAGQAAGAGAALCVRHGISPRKLYETRIGELQQVLLKHDATILNLENDDDADLARGARVTASSSAPGGDVANIVNGINRQFSPEPTNMWISGEGMPQQITLELQRPVEINTIYLTFDTDFSEMTDAATRPTAYDTTVRDYRLSVSHDNQRTELARVTGNYQRRRKHCFPTNPVNEIQLDVELMNGKGNIARLFEVRAYNEPLT